MPDEYDIALSGWRLYLQTFTPMRVQWTDVGGDCDTITANLRIGSQADSCRIACTDMTAVGIGPYREIRQADVRVEPVVFASMGQWKQWAIYHEMGHVLGLEDHVITQCNYDQSRSGFSVFLLMSQYDDQNTLLQPCAPEPTIYDLLGVTCDAYEYECADANAMYTLTFGPSPLYSSGSTSWVWVLTELGNTYDSLMATASVSMGPGVPTGCTTSGWARIMPGPSTFLMVAGEHRFALYRMSITCGPGAPPGIYPQTFSVCVSIQEQDLLLHDCAQASRSIIIW